MYYKLLLQIKPNTQHKDTRREGDHFHWFIKITIHETKQEKQQQQLDHNKSKTPRRAQQTDKLTKHAT